MENEEKKAIQKSILDLLQDLNPDDILPNLFQFEYLNQCQYEELTQLNLPRRKLCQRFLTLITSGSSCCTFQGLLAALRHGNVYPFLASKLEDQLQIELLETRAVNEIDDQTGCDHHQQQQSRDLRSTHERSREWLPSENHTRNGERKPVQIIETVQKIDVFNENRVKMSKLAHTLKRLSHDGNMDKFRKYVSKINKKFNHDKLNSAKDIELRMELADMKFIALEAEASSRRVNYDVTLYGNPLFDDMESLIPYTTNPRVSSMTYLARYGSSVSMLESLDNGLAILQYSKHHAEHVVPCKETGMVYYIEVNLLTQKYEKTPDADLKMKILKTAELAIEQFAGEDEAVQKDYQRMLMLKMVFCRLGIGLFGNQIENAALEESDADAAKEYLDFIERPDIWKGMEKRRKMLFQVAKAEFYRQRKQYELAVPHVVAAVNLARENNWKAELPNIEKLLVRIEQEHQTPRVQQEEEIDPIDEWLGEFSDTDDESNDTEETHTQGQGQIIYQRPNMELLKLQDETLSGSIDPTKMANLKTCQSVQESCSGNQMREHDDFMRTMTTGNGGDSGQIPSMQLLKQGFFERGELLEESGLRMDSLKGFAGVQETCYSCTTESNIGATSKCFESPLSTQMNELNFFGDDASTEIMMDNLKMMNPGESGTSSVSQLAGETVTNAEMFSDLNADTVTSNGPGALN